MQLSLTECVESFSGLVPKRSAQEAACVVAQRDCDFRTKMRGVFLAVGAMGFGVVSGVYVRASGSWVSSLGPIGSAFPRGAYQGSSGSSHGVLDLFPLPPRPRIPSHQLFNGCVVCGCDCPKRLSIMPRHIKDTGGASIYHVQGPDI